LFAHSTLYLNQSSNDKAQRALSGFKKMAFLKSLQDLVAIFTGGSRGNGAGIALELDKRGTNVSITYNSASTQATAVINQLKVLDKD
jgi:hypothetical protein